MIDCELVASRTARVPDSNRWLLNDVLRQQWRFKGLVVSDADAVKSLVNHGYARDLHDAAVRALNAGVDMEMAQDATAFGQSLAAALKSGEISLQQIETADRRILSAKFRLGLFEHPYVDQAQVASVLGAPEHRTQERNRAAAMEELLRLIRKAAIAPIRRVATKPTYASKLRRLDAKSHRAKTKQARRAEPD